MPPPSDGGSPEASPPDGTSPGDASDAPSDARSDTAPPADAPPASDASDAGDRASSGSCAFDITGTLSTVIPTVGVITWQTDLPNVTSARIEFTLNDPQTGELNVGGSGPISVTDRHALMLGLKPGRSYTYRIVATAGTTVCASSDQAIATMADTSTLKITRVAGDAVASRSKGFIVTCAYHAGAVLIIDADGAVVWRLAAPASCSRAHMDWDGLYMWMMSANAATGSAAGGTSGDVRRVRMDGSGAEKLTAGLERSHHDFAVLPGGVTAFAVIGDGDFTDIVERAADGTLHRVAHLDSSTGTPGQSHVNALRYYARDDSYTFSDLQSSSVANLSRQGKVLWRSGGSGQSSDTNCASLSGTHGHQLLPNGNLLDFRASVTNPTAPSPVCELSFTQSGSTRTTALAWSYPGAHASYILGDVQRLPNGNTLVTYSTDGIIAEVTPAGTIVQTLADGSSSQFGYSTFRETLYGPPQ